MNRLDQVIGTLRGTAQWGAAYSLLEQVKSDATGPKLGWVFYQLAITRYIQNPAQARSSLALTDRAIASSGSDQLLSVRVHINGTVFAEYLAEVEKHSSYVNALLRLLREPREEITPWFGRIYARVGLYYQRALHDNAKAAGWFERAVRFYRGNSGPYGEHDRSCQLRFALVSYAECVAAAGRQGGAVKAYKRALRMSANDTTAMTPLIHGRLAEYSGSYSDAESRYKDALDLARNSRDHLLVTNITLDLVRIYRRRGQEERVAPLVEPLVLQLIDSGVPGMVLRLQRALSGHSKEGVMA